MLAPVGEPVSQHRRSGIRGSPEIRLSQHPDEHAAYGIGFRERTRHPQRVAVKIPGGNPALT